MGWGASGWGSTGWGSGAPATPVVGGGLSAWNAFLGSRQWRIEPAIVPPVEGEWVFALGGEGLPEAVNLEVGDYIEASQTADFETTTLFLLSAAIRSREDPNLGSLQWELSLRIDDVARAVRRFGEGASVDIQLGANVAALSGEHKLSIRLEVV